MNFRRKLTNKEFKQRYKPWVTFALLNSMKRRDTLFKKYIRTNNCDRKQTIHNEYKTLINQILELTRSSKKTLYQNYFTENNDNLRKIWPGIKEIINVKGKFNNIPVCVTENNEIVTERTGVSNEFNNYY